MRMKLEPLQSAAQQAVQELLVVYIRGGIGCAEEVKSGETRQRSGIIGWSVTRWREALSTSLDSRCISDGKHLYKKDLEATDLGQCEHGQPHHPRSLPPAAGEGGTRIFSSIAARHRKSHTTRPSHLTRQAHLTCGSFQRSARVVWPSSKSGTREVPRRQ